MERIKAFKDLFLLESGQKIENIKNGNPEGYRFLFAKNDRRGTLDCDYAILESSYNVRDVIKIDWHSFDRYELYVGDYDSKFVGNRLIEQLEDKIKSVKEVYLKD
jgi:hypothetical protein